MLKPDSLRAALTAGLVDAEGVKFLERDPDKLAIFVDEGRIVSRMSAEPDFPAPAFEYRYRLNAILQDFTGHPDAVMVAIVLWLHVHQPELLQNHDKGDKAIVFDADIIDANTIDLSIELELTETVAATAREDGSGYDLVHVAEPPPIDEIAGVPRWTPLKKVYLGGELIIDAEA